MERLHQSVHDVALETVSGTHDFIYHVVERHSRVYRCGVDGDDSVRSRHRLLHDCFDAAVDEELGIGQPADVGPHEFGEVRIDGAQYRDDAEPYLVAHVLRRAVRGVLPEGDAVGRGVVEYLPAGGEEQRADDFPVYPVDAGEPLEPRAPHQVDEERFDGVVGMVGDGDGVVAVLGAQFAEPFIAQPPGGYLYRFSGGFHFALRVEPAVEEGETIPCGTHLYERFVLVRLLSAQLEVAVRDTDLVAGRHEKVHHDHRIHASADGEQYPVVRFHQRVFSDIPLKFLFEHSSV